MKRNLVLSLTGMQVLDGTFSNRLGPSVAIGSLSFHPNEVRLFKLALLKDYDCSHY